MKTVKRIAILFLILAVWLGCDIWMSSNWLKVNTYEFASEKIDQPVTAVILSDLHDHDFEGRLLSRIQEIHPDLILMDGDMINSYTDQPEKIFDLIRECCRCAPVYFALGNHEIAYMENNPEWVSEIEKCGAAVLEKNYADLNINGNAIRIGGLYEYAFGQDQSGYNKAQSAPEGIRDFLLDFVDTDAFRLMLSHRPDSFIFGDVSQAYDIELVVSGHNHGGQVVIPFLGGLFGGDQGYFPKYIHGLYTKDRIHLLITSGLGTSKKILPRINNRPEIMVLKLNPSGS